MANALGQVGQRSALLAGLLMALSACGENSGSRASSAEFQQVGTVTAAGLDEISGIQAGPASTWYLQNDDGKPLVHVIGLGGSHLAAVEVSGAKNTDWEGLATVPGNAGPLLVIGDIGDNHQQRKSIQLYLLPYPTADAAGGYLPRVELVHTLTLHYPDGPRDCEALAYDPASEQILLLTKRDIPPRLYGIKAAIAETENEATLKFLGSIQRLRPPTPADLLQSPERGAWISQPTGMDISTDGRIAAVITYRSLYLYQRRDGQDWPQAFLAAPVEIRGPPGYYDEAVGFSPDQRNVIVTSEGSPAPIYRLDLSRALLH